MRAREPDLAGFALRDGVRLYYEVFGAGEKTIVFLPPWSICHSRVWKAQIPYFARFARVVTFDGRGNGRSDAGPELDYSDEAQALDVLAVLDASQTQRAVLVSLSAGAVPALMTAARHPERVEAAVFIGPSTPLVPGFGHRVDAVAAFDTIVASHEGWRKFNKAYWKSNYRDFVEFFFSKCFSEPHSTKQIEDAVGWALQTTPETLAATVTADAITCQDAEGFAAAVRCPVLVLHGSDDRIVPLTRGEALARATGGELRILPGSGHIPNARIPVVVNLAIRDFAKLDATPPIRSRPRSRRKRALFLSSPIGLGHAQRDLAIATELRRAHPGVEISWLAQHPVTAVLQGYGEDVHPASASLANESAHFESECGEHDLHAFEAVRRMDEILVANFMVFYDLVRSERFDLVVGDEAWDVDHFLHEHPERKGAAFAWLTDFVGWLPMPDGGESEARLTRDYNLEMIEHIDRSPGLRDRSLFVGDVDDIVPDRFGADLPRIADWTRAHYDFTGYVTGFPAPSEDERQAWRDELGYREGEIVCIVAVGGSGAGFHLLQRITAAFGEVKRRIQPLRMIAVAGPRIDPARVTPRDGLEVRAFVPQLYRHFAACDIALVQGGLTTTMELTAARRPFIYFPLKHHFEQQFHVRHRLSRYRAGRAMDYDDATPETIAGAIEEELARAVDYAPVASDGATKAARLIAALL